MAKKKKIDLTFSLPFFECEIGIIFKRVTEARYGKDALCGIQSGRFWKYTLPVTFFSLDTSPNIKEYGVSGFFCVQNISGYFHLGESSIKACEILEEDREEVKSFIAAIEKELEENSVFKGRAFTLGMQFLDFQNVSLENIVYGEDVLHEIQKHLWCLIEKTDECRSAGIPLQRKVLLEGPFGSGKTITARITAKKAIDNGWTVIYSEPGGAVEHAHRLATLYQPAMVIVEDIDQEQRYDSARQNIFRRILAQVDGLSSKENEIITITTVNDSANIHPALARPGRTDGIVDFKLFNSEDAIYLLRVLIGSMLDSNISDGEWDEIKRECEDLLPAYVNAAATEAKLMAIHQETLVTAEILKNTTGSLNGRHRMINKRSLDWK